MVLPTALSGREYAKFVEDGSGNVTIRATIEGTTGDLTVNGDLDVTGDTTLVDVVTSGAVIIDLDDAEALLVRKDGDAGDILTVDTIGESVFLNAITTTGDFSVTASGDVVVKDGKNFTFASNASTNTRMRGDTTTDEFKVGLGSGMGRQIVITDSANIANDHDHTVTTDPTLFVHSATDPDSDNTEWLSLTHNQTDAVLSSGKGAIKLNAFSNIVLLDAAGDTISLGSDLTGWSLKQDGTNFSFLYNSVEKVYFDLNGGAILDGNLSCSIARTNAQHYHRASETAYGGHEQSTDDGVIQWLGSTGNGNNHWVVTVQANKDKDHDHDTFDTQPKYFFHDETDPDVDNTKWGGIQYDGNNFVLDTGSAAVQLKPGLSRPITTVSGATHTVTFGTDAYLSVTYTATGAVTVTLPDITAGMSGFEIPIKDSGYNAGTFNITVNADGSDTIEAGASIVISGDGDAITIKANVSTNNWEIF